MTQQKPDTADRRERVVKARKGLSHAATSALAVTGLPVLPACRCGCPDDMHIGEIGCPCALPGEPPCVVLSPGQSD